MDVKLLTLPLPVSGVSFEVQFTEQAITHSNYRVSKPAAQSNPSTFSKAEKSMAKRIIEAFEQYWSNAENTFELPLEPIGTPFQNRVWQVMLSIPTGKTQTYGEVARSLKSAPRAVGQACGANPLPLFIPCHRIVGAKHLGGFAHQSDGAMIDMKQALLLHEGAAVPSLKS